MPFDGICPVQIRFGRSAGLLHEIALTPVPFVLIVPAILLLFRQAHVDVSFFFVFVHDRVRKSKTRVAGAFLPLVAIARLLHSVPAFMASIPFLKVLVSISFIQSLFPSIFSACVLTRANKASTQRD